MTSSVPSPGAPTPPDGGRVALFDSKDVANTVRALADDLESWWLDRAERDEFTDVDDVQSWLLAQAAAIENHEEPSR